MRLLGRIGLTGLLVAAVSARGADWRPPFDKSDYVGNVVVQANPWFPLDKAPNLAYGGPDVNYMKPRTADWWKEGLELCGKYGITAVTPEINEPQAWTGCWKSLLESAESVGGGTSPLPKVGMFFGMYSKDKDEVIKSMKRILEPFRGHLKDSKAVLRADGHPVMVVYNPQKFEPTTWLEIFTALDNEFGRMIYLLDVAALAHSAKDDFPNRLRSYLAAFDGVSAYGSGVKMPFDVIKRIMHEEFPQKINEGCAHFNYFVHFHHGGNRPDLTKNWRVNLESALATDPDSIMLTNLFDHYENSLVYPCYEREDFVLRYLEWRLEK